MWNSRHIHNRSFTFQYSLSVKCVMFRKINLNCFNYNSGFKFFSFNFHLVILSNYFFEQLLIYNGGDILSCHGKDSTSVLCKRLTTFAVKVNLIRENHGGFRENYSTIDNMFLLYSLIELSSQGDMRSSFTIVKKNVNIS